MPYDFDQFIDRRQTHSLKWQVYGPEVLPLWVADMDFAAPPAVLQALQARVAHGVFGYELPSPELFAVICERLAQLYAWPVAPDQIIFLPGLVTGINVVCRALRQQPGDSVLTLTPAYPPFLSAPGQQGLDLQMVELTPVRAGPFIHYEIDYAAFEAAITPRTRLFLLCHPHNPTGCSYTREQLTRLAEICLRHDLIICSDEIHCDLLLGDTTHTPLAALAPEIAARTITLMAPSKTFNLPGLGCSFAVVPDEDLRRRLNAAAAGMVPLVNALGLAAALAAYRDGADWLTELRAYLTANRDALVTYLPAHLPQLAVTAPQATYLAWVDCRQAGLTVNPYEFFLKQAHVALNNGADFGPGGAGFVRLNFGCPRTRLMQALGQMRAALSNLSGTGG